MNLILLIMVSIRSLFHASLLATSVAAADFTAPGAVTTPFPTITNLAVEWQITGDDNLNAACEVKFRAASSAVWTTGLPLRRVPAGSSRGTTARFTWTNRLSGSLFDLQPDTEYEIELKLHDPDGGEATKLVTARTRPVPTPAANAREKSSGPRGLKDVVPGDLVLLEDGDYGAARFTKDGEPGRPIVYRSTTGKAIFSEVGLSDRKWVYLEGVTINGPVRLNGTEHCAVMRCTIHAQWGIKAYKPGMMNGYIADNIITGIQPWKSAIMGADGDNEGEGIQITGSGNVICHNRVSGFRDCLSHLEDDSAAMQMCNDWHNNDISAGLDDGIEADFALSNCRIMRNRITNCFVGISSQPGLGGPNYFIRNVMFNLTYSAFKLHRFSQGDVILHNTVVKAGDGLGNYTSEPFDHALFRNNLFIGGKADIMEFGGYNPGRGRGIDVQLLGVHCSFDYNAYGSHGLPFEGKFRSHTFKQLPGTEFEPHGMQVGLDVFENAPFPTDPTKLQAPPDLRSKSGSPIIDSAIMMPNINDTFTGKAADRGAYEFGQPLPVYGSRP